MKIAVLGSGGREHALAWKLAQSPHTDKLYVIPGNGGTENNLPLSLTDFPALKKELDQLRVDLVVVGPENPLTEGIVDFFRDSGIRVFGPDQQAARLEGSKLYAKQFMRKYGVSTADFREFGPGHDSLTELKKTISDFGEEVVIKYDGLAAGKGVFVCNNMPEVEENLADMFRNFGRDCRFLLEKKLKGSELSILGFTDGHDIRLLLPSQDHKQLLDGDAGPNTGGMGAFCPVPFCDEKMITEIRKKIIEPTMQGIRTEKFNYTGVLYFGLMITAEGPFLLEYNVRLGDPETEVVLPALQSDLVELIEACFHNELSGFPLEFVPGYFLDVVLTAGGYPGPYEKGLEIYGLNDLDEDIMVFHAGTKKANGHLVTNGGRILNIVARGNSLEDAIRKVYSNCERIVFKNAYYRRDIGKRVNRIPTIQ
ncbi:MAG: phosphoribosylamine--glycine ligase [Candidatus Cloacimonetes bacterium]|nr:phosphoribosylamine--glycine ligase [Candidatus Cloacimonadota bacterium]